MMLRKNGYINYLINFLLVANFDQFKGVGGGGTSTMVFSKTNQVLSNLKWINFQGIIERFKQFCIP